MDVGLSEIVQVLRYGGSQKLETRVRNTVLSRHDAECLLYIARQGSALLQDVFFSTLLSGHGEILRLRFEEIVPGEMMTRVRDFEQCRVVREMFRLGTVDIDGVLELARAWPLYKKYRDMRFQALRELGYTPVIAMSISNFLP